jgi:hypothetical protein
MEGDSDIIDEEEDDVNNSFDNMRKSYKAKRPKSLDDFDGEEEDEHEDEVD